MTDADLLNPVFMENSEVDPNLPVRPQIDERLARIEASRPNSPYKSDILRNQEQYALRVNFMHVLGPDGVDDLKGELTRLILLEREWVNSFPPDETDCVELES